MNSTPLQVVRRYSSFPKPFNTRVVRSREKSVIHVNSKYESLDYDVRENELLIKEEHSRGYKQIIRINVTRWILYFLIGLITGLIAVGIDISVLKITNYKYKFLSYYIDYYVKSDRYYIAYIIWYLSVITPVFIGSFIVIFIEPGAAGSGLPFVISHLNGVKIPNFSKLNMLFIKVLSVICSCVAGLAGGKEGPFIHIGSIVGGLLASARISCIPALANIMYSFRANKEVRDMMVGGCAAGVSAAFGSPVGATLMSLEEGTSFWSVNLMWKIFFCSIVSCFFFNTILNSVIGHSGQHANLGSFYFGKFNETSIEYEYFELPIFIGVGVIGGACGALFVTVNMKITVFRMRHVSSKWLQMIDCLVISFLTTTFAIFSVTLLNHCKPKETLKGSTHTIQLEVGLKTNRIGVGFYEALLFLIMPLYRIVLHTPPHMLCNNNEYNEVSTFWFQTQESLLRLLFHSSTDAFSLSSLFVFFVLYFVLVVITLGINVSAGIFIPSLLLGASWGRIIGLVLHQLFPNSRWAIPGKYALLGAAAHLGGVIRITISLAVVMIEATGTLNLGLPLMITLFITKWVGDFFTEGMYESQIGVLGIPVLPSEPPSLTSDILAKDLMSKRVSVFPCIVPVSYLLDTMKRVSHHGFPVVNASSSPQKSQADGKSQGQLSGFVLRSELITLLKTKCFQRPKTIEEVYIMLDTMRQHEFSSTDISEVYLTEEEMLEKIDLTPFMNTSPYSIQEHMSFPRIFRLFRGLGLRHVIVVNSTNEVTGIITRKDLARFRLWRHAASMGLKELRIH